MKALLPALVFAFAAMGLSIPAAADDEYWLKDGSLLTLRSDGTMSMVDKDGAEMDMADGQEMELVDGGIIMMKNRHVWKRIGPPGKGQTVLEHE